MTKKEKTPKHLSEETKEEIKRERSVFRSFLAYEKDKWFFHTLELLFLVFTFVMTPMTAYTLPANETPAIINKLYDDLGTGEEDSTIIGSVGFYTTTNYYRPNDFPMSGVLKLWYQKENKAFKVYNGKDITITNPATGDKDHFPLLATTTTRNDEVRDGTFMPVDENGGNSWSLASNWSYFPVGNEIGVPQSYADQLLTFFELEPADYQSLLGKTITVNHGQRTTSEEFQIACVFNDKDPAFGWISPYLGTFFLTRLELQLYSTPQLVFEVGEGETGRDRLTSFLSSIDSYFPDSSTISDHRLSFYEYSSEENKYVQNPVMTDFLGNMYSCQAPENSFVLMVMPLLFVIAGYLAFAVTTFFDVRNNTESKDVKYSSWHFLTVHLIGLIISLLALSIIKDFAIGGAYQVPVFTTPNLFLLLGVLALMAITTALIITISNFWIKKRSWLTKDGKNENPGNHQ